MATGWKRYISTSATENSQHSVRHHADCQNEPTSSGNPHRSILTDITSEVINKPGFHNKERHSQKNSVQIQQQPQQPSHVDPHTYHSTDPGTETLIYQPVEYLINPHPKTVIEPLIGACTDRHSHSAADPHRNSFPDTFDSEIPLPTDPGDIARLWDVVFETCKATISKTITYLTNTTTMPEETRHPFDPQGFALPSFKDVLAQYNITIKSTQEDKARLETLLSFHEPNLPETSTISEAGVKIEAGEEEKDPGPAHPPTPVSFLHCKKTREQLEILVDRFEDATRPHISIMDMREILNVSIFLSNIEDVTVPQVKVTHSMEMISKLDPGYLLPPRIRGMSPNGKPSDPSNPAKKSTKEGPVSGVSSRTESKKTSTPLKLKLGLPLVGTDFSYWLKHELRTFQEGVPTIVPFDSTGRTSPYLTIVFDDIPRSTDHPVMDLPIVSNEMRIFYVQHKLAVHGAAALYNLWRARPEGKKSSILHFGITISAPHWFHIFVFEPIRKADNAGWGGCEMNRVASGILVNPFHLQELLNIYNQIQEWGIRVHADRLRKEF